MSITSRLLGVRAPSQVANLDRTPQAATGNAGWSTPGSPQTPRWNADSATTVGYYGHIYAYRCARTIATTIAGLPFRAGPSADNPGTYTPTARLSQLLGPPPGGPAPGISPRRLWTWSIVSYLVAGRYGWETPVNPATNEITALWPLVGGRLHPIPTAGGVAFFSGYEYWLNATKRLLQLDQVHYSWRPSQDDWREPESVLQAASLPLSTAIALDKHMYAFMRNNMVGAKMVVTPEFEDTAMRRAFQDQFLAEMTGWDNAGRTAFAEWEDTDDGTPGQARTPSIQVVDLGTKPVDAQTIEQIRELKHDICVAFGVPVSMLGDASQRTYNNADQEHRNYWTGTILPLIHEIADDINMTLAPRLGSEVGWFDITKVEALRPAHRFIDADPLKLIEGGVILPAEYREDRDLPPDLPKDPNAPLPSPEPAVDDTPGASMGGGGMGRRYAAESVDPQVVHDYLAENYPERVLGWVDDARWKFDPQVPLDRIKMARRPGGRDPEKVAGIAQAVLDGKKMAPVVLVDTGEDGLEIADGYHRTLAFDKAGRKTIPAFIGSGVGLHGPWERDMHDAKLNRSAGERWDESQHPRSHGKFAAKGGGSDANTVPTDVGANLKDFQRRHGLPQTGVFDNATVKTIHDVLAAKTARKGRKKTTGAHAKTAKPTSAKAQGLPTVAHVKATPKALRFPHRAADNGHLVATERLMRYWAEGAGAAKIGWGTDGDFDRCRLNLGRYVQPGEVDGLCANLHHRATGARPGHAPGEQRDALLESSSAGALLPKAGRPMLPVPRQAHLPTVGAARGRCGTCGQPASAPIHNLGRSKRGTRHAGPDGHTPVQTGHASARRRQKLAAVHREADQLEPAMTRVMADVFAAQKKATVDRLGGKRGKQMLRAATPPERPADGQPPDDTTAPLVDAAQIYDLTHWIERTKGALDPVYAAVTTLVTDRMGRQFGDDVTQGSLGAVQHLLDRRLQRLAATVSRTTFDQIALALREGISEGQTLPQMITAVERVFDDAQANRAPMIARTEVLGALNDASHLYATKAGPHVVAGKEWLSAHDNRVRHTHRDADGQVQAIDRPFTVGGSPMMFPLDPAAPPSEVVSCRCVPAFLTPDEYAKHVQPTMTEAA